MAVLLAGCGGPAWDYDAPGGAPSLAVGSGGDAPGPSATSAGGSNAQGGAGGEGGVLPFVGTTGQGGAVPNGAGGGGGEPCEPGPNPCDGMPDGQCGEWVDSCGNAIVCGGEEACGSPLMHCDDVNVCRCQDATGYGLAVNTCAALGSGVASFCGDDGPNADAPVDCVDTGVQAPGGSVIWCCG